MLELGELLDAAAKVLLIAEAGVEEGANQIERERLPDDLRAEAEHGDVVMLDGLMCGIDIVAEGGADTRDLVGGDAGADSRAADEDRAVGASVDKLRANGLGDVREVDRLRRVRAEVADLMAPLPERVDDWSLEWKTGMIAADCQPHARACLRDDAHPCR